MSWINRELKKREQSAQPSAAQPVVVASDAARMQALWAKFKAANAALPSEIQLRVEKGSPVPPYGEQTVFLEWLRAPNGAALGFAGYAIRYLWPDKSQRKSNNFWIRWDVQQQRYLLNQRVNALIPPRISECSFDDRRTDHMTKCLVQGKRITARAVRKKRLWIF